MNKLFQFKQFSVDQTNCGMKVNTDAAILGAIANVAEPSKILEIGTGTGVIALMLSQRYETASVDAVEIDEKTAATAALNLQNSPFAERMNLVISSFQAHFRHPQTPKYDLIISNPPYFINSLKSEADNKRTARHTDQHFFEYLVRGSAEHLTDQGLLYLILPLDTAERVRAIASAEGLLFLHRYITIHSFPESDPYRCILAFGKSALQPEREKFVIYQRQGIYTDEYRALLRDFLIIF